MYFIIQQTSKENNLNKNIIYRICISILGHTQVCHKVFVTNAHK